MRLIRLRADGLFERMDELKAEKAGLSYHILAQDSGNDRRSFAGNQAGRRGRRGRDRELNRLIAAKDMLAGNAGAESADIKGLSELNEF